MFYVEQVFFDNGPVRVTVYSEKVTNGLIFRDYKEATPEKPLMKELPGRMIYVDACPTLLAALARAAQLGKENGVQFRMAADVRTQAASARAKRGAKSRWKK
ncbi:MAG: hypothetical protein KH315_11490 [Faecalibacterium prausnitzii]|uniref:Uncharacterized protein n=1 Tax=Faecalibacterium prausnitzii TaxID=853 RepID=A0A9E1GLW3_9FIRM|nr:hypothetical protein [Faecalibacterium prausnitzii]